MRSQATRISELSKRQCPEFAHRHPIIDAVLGGLIFVIATAFLVGHWVWVGSTYTPKHNDRLQVHDCPAPDTVVGVGGDHKIYKKRRDACAAQQP